MDEVKDGKKTTEWKAVLLTVLTALVAVGGALMGTDLLKEGTLAAVIVSALLTVAGSVITYIRGRSQVKSATSVAKAMEDF